ncbi:MAG TPA: GNAT family N-acetyltransferase [Candidatus Limnocylindrales bacterium]|nr:GNAT family N-acetyltransferase [Candidatus Limnocylindrales bacterium]
MTIAIRRAAPEDYATLARIINAVTPEAPNSVENMEWSDATYPGGARFLAELDGTPVGAATTGRIFMFQPDFDAYWGDIHVLEGARRRGVGSALFGAISDDARGAGKTHLHVPASTARPDSIAFLEPRGFVEYDRWKVLALDLTGLEPPAVELPPGIVVTTLADRPDLIDGVHAVAVESFGDIPTGGEPISAGTLDEFRKRDVDRAEIPHEAFMIAVEAATGDVVGYASVMFLPGSTTRGFHDMTAVRRAWRGRRVGRALKQATIAWSIRNGLVELETGNEDRNARMRALNDSLGYTAQPDDITFRGPVASAKIGP